AKRATAAPTNGWASNTRRRSAPIPAPRVVRGTSPVSVGRSAAVVPEDPPPRIPPDADGDGDGTSEPPSTPGVPDPTSGTRPPPTTKSGALYPGRVVNET